MKGGGKIDFESTLMGIKLGLHKNKTTLTVQVAFILGGSW